MKLLYFVRPAIPFALFAGAAAAQQQIYSLNGSSGQFQSDHIGRFVRNVGDVDGDGYEDFGASNRPSYCCTAISEFRVASGKTGLAIGQKISGGPNGGTNIGEQFGEAACCAGDMNLDGFLDIAVSAPDGPFSTSGSFGQSGTVSIYSKSGSTWTAIKTWNLAADDVDFGYSLLALGDTNGDGFPDLAISDPLSGPGGNSAGHIRYYSLATPAGLGITINGSGAGEQFGASMIPAGYVDGDNVLDYYVGAPFGGASTSGLVRLVSGASGATLATISGTAALEHFGRRLAPAGDLDGDGVADFFATVDLPGGAAVRAYSTLSGVLWTYSPPTSSSTFGAELASISDVDGDGIRDVFVTDESGAVTTSKLPILLSGRTSALLPQVVAAPPLPGNSVFQGATRSVATLENVLGDSGRVIAGNPTYDEHSGSIGVISGTARGFIYAESGVERFGTGTPGCSGAELLSTSGNAKLGNATFQVQGSAAPASSLGLLLFTDKKLQSPADPMGIAVLQCIDILTATQIYALDFNSDLLGAAQITIPIPSTPTLAGATFYGQSIWAWPPATCTPSTYGLSSSTCLALRIQK